MPHGASTAYEIAEKGITHVGAALRAAFAMIPYEWICKDEAEAKRYFLLFCKFMKADISGERQSARGRADAVLKTPGAVPSTSSASTTTRKRARSTNRSSSRCEICLNGGNPSER